MTDIVSENRLLLLHPAVRDKALAAYREAVRITPVGVHPYITETLRSFERSDALYNQPWDGKDNDGDGRIDEADEKVTNAKGGRSLHNYGLAIDFAISVNGKTPWIVDKNWMLVVTAFKKQGFIWGADWDNDGKTKQQGDKDEHLVDAPHFEMSFGYTWQQLLEKYNRKEFITGTKYLKL